MRKTALGHIFCTDKWRHWGTDNMIWFCFCRSLQTGLRACLPAGRRRCRSPLADKADGQEAQDRLCRGLQQGRSSLGGWVCHSQFFVCFYFDYRPFRGKYSQLNQLNYSTEKTTDWYFMVNIQMSFILGQNESVNIQQSKRWMLIKKQWVTDISYQSCRIFPPELFSSQLKAHNLTPSPVSFWRENLNVPKWNTNFLHLKNLPQQGHHHNARWMHEMESQRPFRTCLATSSHQWTSVWVQAQI